MPRPIPKRYTDKALAHLASIRKSDNIDPADVEQTAKLFQDLDRQPKPKKTLDAALLIEYKVFDDGNAELGVFYEIREGRKHIAPTVELLRVILGLAYEYAPQMLPTNDTQ